MGILAFQAMSEKERAELVREKEAKIESIESEFKAFVEALQKQYTEAQEKKDADLSNIRSSGLGLLKAVQATQQKEELRFADNIASGGHVWARRDGANCAYQ